MNCLLGDLVMVLFPWPVGVIGMVENDDTIDLFFLLLLFDNLCFGYRDLQHNKQHAMMHMLIIINVPKDAVKIRINDIVILSSLDDDCIKTALSVLFGLFAVDAIDEYMKVGCNVDGAFDGLFVDF